MRLIHGRLAAVSVRASIGAGAWVGFALGLVAGALLGALLAWFAGAILGWQRELGLTLGMTHALLPFGDQIPALRWLSGNWWLVIPISSFLVGSLAAVVGGLIGGLLAAAYNRSPRHANVVVEIADASEAEAVDRAGLAAEPGTVTDARAPAPDALTAEAAAAPNPRPAGGDTRGARGADPGGSPRTR